MTSRKSYVERTPETIRLFQTVIETSREVGWEKAWAKLEDEKCKGRIGWFEENKDKFHLEGTDVEKAYRLLYVEFLNLGPSDGEIVEKTENRIVTRWYNPCDVLEACVALGLDTREICKRVYKKSAQVLISQINPKLRFRRTTHRPHSPYCEEIIELIE